MAAELEIGTKVGAWLVQKKLPYGNKYKCLCTICGKTVKNVRVYDLIKGKTRSCKSCSVGASKASHGMSDTPEYNSWVHMVQRCHNKKNKDYKNYGARGIAVCDLWRESFEAFYLAVGPKPTLEHTIERIDYNRGYEPGNVVWATRSEQVLNKRDNVYLTIGNRSATVSQWADVAPVSADTIYKRISRGWLEKFGAEYTVFTPSQKGDAE